MARAEWAGFAASPNVEGVLRARRLVDFRTCRSLTIVQVVGRFFRGEVRLDWEQTSEGEGAVLMLAPSHQNYVTRA